MICLFLRKPKMRRYLQNSAISQTYGTNIVLIYGVCMLNCSTTSVILVGEEDGILTRTS